MNKYSFSSFFFSSLLLAALLVPAIGLTSIPVTGISSGIYLPLAHADQTLAGFISTVSGSSSANQVVGVYQYKNLQAPVVQQPSGQAGYVSTNPGTLTQFASAANYGVMALLAHNYLEGQYFFNIQNGNKIVLIFGDGHTSAYRVNAVKQFQALSPTSPYSKFIDLDDPTQSVLTSSDLFYEVYATEGRLVLQTCIERDGQSSWGRLFVIADPIDVSETLAMQ